MGKKKDTRISGVNSTSRTRSIEQAESVTGVDSIKATSSVGRIEKAGAIRRRGITRIMSLAEREELFKMINEEAERLFAEGALSPDKKKAVASAVKMAIDIGMAGEETEEDKSGDGSAKK